MVLHDPQSVESMGVDLQIQRADYKLYLDFQLGGRSEPRIPVQFKGQLYMVLF